MASSTEKTVLTAVLVVIVVFVTLNFLALFTGGFNGLNIFPDSGIPTVISLSIFPLILLAVWIVVTVWVYRDAESRGMSGALWALLIFVGNIIGLIIYLIVRNDHDMIVSANLQMQNYVDNKKITCTSCSKDVSEKFDYCPHCGNPMKSACSSCGKPFESNWKVCPYCGEKLGAD